MKKLHDGNLVDMTPEEIAQVQSMSLPVVRTPEDFDTALTNYLDAVARSRRYQDRISCAVRAAYPGPFQAEGTAFAIWMDSCNQQAYQILEAYQQGQIPEPSIEEFIEMFPLMVWPE